MTTEPISTDQKQKLETYQDLVREYARVLDLSSPKMLAEFDQGVQKALLFSNFITERARVFDLGSGVGLPGIPLAILHPQNQFTLCEIRQKRAAFLDRCATQLKLEHVSVFAQDAKKYSSPADVVTALWVGTLKLIYQTCQHFLEPNWSILTIKGDTLESELVELSKIATIRSVDRVKLEDEAHLVRVNGVK
jgi:16S rRNA (guanine527-N7)-methyltransferase